MKTGLLAAGLAAAFGALALFAAPGGGGPRAGGASPPGDIAKVLDDLHDSASRADENAYFGLFAADGVFLGTDGTERWSKEEFRAYAKPYFSKGQGWTYLPRPNSRHIAVSTDGGVAWFDELLDNAKYGECRGSGVLVSTPEGWKIVQYNLSVPVPNDLLPKVADMIKDAAPKSKPRQDPKK